MALKFEITGDNSNLLSSLEGAKAGVRRAAQDIEDSGMGIEDMFKRIGAAAGIAFSLDQAKSFIGKVTEVRAFFQDIETSMEVFLGNQQKAAEFTQQLKDYAYYNMFEFKDLADASKQMIAYGHAVDDVIPRLDQLSNIATGTKADLMELVNLYNRAKNLGEVGSQGLASWATKGLVVKDVLKEMGEECDGTTVTFEQLNKVLDKVTGEGGMFHDLMLNQMSNISAEQGQLEDNLASMYNEIGEKYQDFITGAIKAESWLVDHYKEIGNTILGIIALYGTYKAAVMTYVAIQKVHTAWIALEQTAHLQNTLATEAEIAAKGKATVATVLFDKANKALNATMLANPYVLIGMAIIGLSVAIYKAASATDELDEAQERLNGHTKNIEASVLGELDKLDALNRRLQECEKGTEEYKKVKQTIIDQYGKYYSGLDAEIEKVGNLSGVYDQLTEAIRHTIGARNLKSFYDSEMDNYDKTVSSKLDKAYKSLKEKYGDNEGSRLYHNLYSSTILGNEDALSADDVKKLQKTTFWDVRWGKNAKDGLVDVRASVDDLREDIYDTKAASDKVLKEYKDMYEIADEQWNEIIYGNAGSTSDSNYNYKKGGGNKNNADNIASEKERLEEMQDDLEFDRIRSTQDLEQRITDARIAAMADGAEKVRLQQEQQNKEEIASIERQKEDAIRKYIDEEKKLFEQQEKIKKLQNTKYKGKKFDESKVDTSAIAAKYDEIISLTNQQQLQNIYQDSLRSMRDYLKEYGTIEQQRLAITQEYEEKIEKAVSPTVRASLMLERDQSLKDFDAKQFEEQIDWAGIFSDLQGHTKEYLEGLRDQLQGVLNQGNLAPDQMAVVQEKLREINGEISKQNGLFQFVGDRQREHTRLVQEAADAEKALKKAKEDEVIAQQNVLDVTKQIGDILESVGIGRDVDLNDELLTQFDSNSEEYKQMASLLEKLRIGEGNLAKARRETANATNKAKNAEDAKKRDSSQAIADWFSDAQQFITEKGIDQIPDLLGEIGLGKMGEKASLGLSAFNNAAGAAADFASGNYIGAALKGIGAVKDFGRLLGIGGGNGAEVQATTERLTEANEKLADRISLLTDEIGNSAGLKAIAASEAALTAQKEIQDNNLEILRKQMAYWSSHHSNAYYADDNKIASLYKEARGRLTSINSDFAKYNVRSLQDVYKLIEKDPAYLKTIKEYAPDLWEYLTTVGKYDKSEYWEKVVGEAGKVDEITERINNNLTQTSFDSLRDSYLDSLTDMKSSSEDFAKSFEDMMFKAMINSLVLDDEFDEWLKKWRDSYAEAIKNGDTLALENLRNSAVAMRETKVAERDLLAQTMGYSGSDKYKQEATSKGFQAMSQDTGDELNGRFTALQIAGETVATQAIQIYTQMVTMAAIQTSSNNALLEIRNMMITANSYLDDVAKYSKKVYLEFGEKLDSLVDNTKNM